MKIFEFVIGKLQSIDTEIDFVSQHHKKTALEENKQKILAVQKHIEHIIKIDAFSFRCNNGNGKIRFRCFKAS